MGRFTQHAVGAVLLRADEDEPENWHVATNRVKSIVLYQHDGELDATLVDETSELR